ncbi:MAG: gas vesicle protein [Myxococcales bacterium]|nr:gas vesicle protein [Myxococcales bacterium]
MSRHAITHGTKSSSLADILERVLDKGVVIAGDIKIKLVEIELLTIQIRLVVCSVERAVEMGMDWWRHDPNLSSAKLVPPKSVIGAPPGRATQAPALNPVEARLEAIEAALARLEGARETARPSPRDDVGE